MPEPALPEPPTIAPAGITSRQSFPPLSEEIISFLPFPFQIPTTFSPFLSDPAVAGARSVFVRLLSNLRLTVHSSRQKRKIMLEVRKALGFN
jgi:hypothetical protein